MKPLLLILATVIDLTGTSNYIWNIFRGSTRPHRTTRFVLFGVSAVNMLGAISAHAYAGTLILSALFLARGLILAILSVKKGLGGTSVTDIICGTVAVAGIVAWKLSGSGVTALAFAIMADATAYIPAVIKTWKHPKTEAPLLYWLGGLAAFIAVLHDGIRLSVIFQLFVILSCATMLFCIYQDNVRNALRLKAEPPL